jgi:4-phospho-D-threonate 3-dehydrogenase / 4-phospho-D-erythronate 3-dehydrogenase
LAKPHIAVSIGDLNGIGFEIALTAHDEVKKICEPVYFISKKMAVKCAELLGKSLPDDFETVNIFDGFDIEPGQISSKAGLASYVSFASCIGAVESGSADAVVTLPISKEAWMKAGLEFVGHTDALKKHFKKNAIMTLGCEQMMVALFTDHIPLAKVAWSLKKKRLVEFLKLLKTSSGLEKAVVLGLNPHAGDGGALGDEDKIIKEAINEANSFFGSTVFDGPAVPDAIFNPRSRSKYNWFVAMYHDQGLIPLKALHFEESINVSFGLPIVRTSVDHGTAFDIAYKGANPSALSYLNAVRCAVKLLKVRDPSLA